MTRFLITLFYASALAFCGFTAVMSYIGVLAISR
jgi:hypothetical protein